MTIKKDDKIFYTIKDVSNKRLVLISQTYSPDKLVEMVKFAGDLCKRLNDAVGTSRRFVYGVFTEGSDKK